MDATAFLDFQEAFVYLFSDGLTWMLVFTLAGAILLGIAMVGLSMARRVNKT